MKRILLLWGIVLLIPTPSFADRYKVLFANSKGIIINGTQAKKGLCFDDTNSIVWTSEEQVLKVLNLSTSKVYIISAKDYKKHHVISLSEYLHSLFGQVNHLSTKEIETPTKRYLLDTLHIEASSFYAKKKKFSAITKIGTQAITTPLKWTKDKRNLIINRKIYGGRYPIPVDVDIIMTDKGSYHSEYLYQNIHIEPLPLNVD